MRSPSGVEARAVTTQSSVSAGQLTPFRLDGGDDVVLPVQGHQQRQEFGVGTGL